MSAIAKRILILSIAIAALGILRMPGANAQTAVFEKPIRFSLDPAFLQNQTLDEIKQNLIGYVADFNTIFGKSTSRRFVFDPGTGVEFFSAPSTGGACLPITTSYGYLIQVKKSTNIVSFGGNGFCNLLNTDELMAGNFNWLRVYSRQEIQDRIIPELLQYDDYYLRQVENVVHELGHLHGLGLGEYYSINSVDGTGVAPDLSVNVADPANFYRLSRPLLRTEPMWGVMDVTVPSVRTLQFAPFSSYIINRVASGAVYSACPSPVMLFSSCFDIASHAPQRLVTVQLLDSATQAPIPSCTVQALRLQPNLLGSYLIAEALSDADGRATFDLSPDLANDNFHILAYFKSNCGGAYLPAGDVFTTFDYQAFLFAPGGGVVGDFRYNGNWIIQAELRDAIAPVVAFGSPLDGESVLQKSQVAISVNATDNKSVASVDVFVDGVLLCRSTSAPYGCNWIAPKYDRKQELKTIRSVATDNSGNTQAMEIGVRVVQNQKK